MYINVFSYPKQFLYLCDYLINSREEIAQINIPAIFEWSKKLFEKDIGWIHTYIKQMK